MVKKNPLYQRLRENYLNLEEFIKNSGVPVSPESCRRAISKGLPVSAPILMLIAKYLGFSHAEIKQLLIKQGDKHFHEFIEETQVPFDAREQAIIEAVKEIKHQNPAMLNSIADNLELISKAVNIDISKQLKKIRRKER